MSGSAFAVTHHAFSSGAGRTSDGNGSHASTLKSPSYTKSVSWQHYRIYTATYHLDNQTSIEVADDTGQLCLGVLLEINHGVPALHLNVSGGDKLLHVHAAQGGLVLTPDSSGVRFQGAECDRYAYRDQNSLLVKEQ
ncbi:hypothetical protein [Klebsiella pneumoniae]|uniref:hypothetical protein n=1 Tax=Klebsiella pneumoniae TaxID=573 RepID=UPI00214B160B|nr:hypothetical protein [Klebsiella pneumoniae]MEB5808706.1 hypothetical protein [Klebsiella pneumoniae]